jgi:hypothetical protein
MAKFCHATCGGIFLGHTEQLMAKFDLGVVVVEKAPRLKRFQVRKILAIFIKQLPCRNKKTAIRNQPEYGNDSKRQDKRYGYGIK